MFDKKNPKMSIYSTGWVKRIKIKVWKMKVLASLLIKQIKPTELGWGVQGNSIIEEKKTDKEDLSLTSWL